MDGEKFKYNENKPMIPRKIFQSWKTHTIPQDLQKNVSALRTMNPDYSYYLFDDNDCRQYLLENFGQNYANAFDAIKPGAFKCDFWRYAILYLEGGIYMDLDMELLEPFDTFIDDSKDFISIVDIPKYAGNQAGCIFQAFIACKPRHPILKYALELSFYNIASRRQEFLESLSITGPVAMGTAVNLYLNRKNPYQIIEKGDYGNMLLFSWDTSETFTVSDKGVNIIRNKVEAYKPISNYMLMVLQNDIYTDDPRKPARNRRLLFICIFILFAILVIWFLRKRLSSCESSCIRHFKTS
jgi:hypothetical protein